MNKLEYVCFSWRLTGKTLITLYVQYLLHLKKNPSHQGNLLQRLKPCFSLVVIKYGSVSSNHNIDTMLINIRMFCIMFEVSLLFASFKISTFMNKPLFIHTSEKL